MALMVSYAFYQNNKAYDFYCKNSFIGIVQAQQFTIQRDIGVMIMDSIYSLSGFALKEGDDILLGDSLVKLRCSKTMKVFRKDSISNQFNQVGYYYLTGKCENCK